MAIQGFITPTSYAVVEGVYYSKQRKTAEVRVKVYADSTKARELASLVYLVDGYVTHKELVPASNTPPEQPSRDFRYLVGASPVAEWSGWAGRIAEWLDTNWGFEPLNADLGSTNPLWDAGNQRYVKYVNGELVEVDCLDGRVFDTYFSVTTVETTGVLGAAYDFLKSRPEFANVQDV